MNRFWSSYNNLGAYFLESLQGLLTLTLFKRDADRGRTLDEQAQSFRKSTMDVLRIQLSSLTFMDTVAFVGTALAISISAHALSLGVITS